MMVALERGGTIDRDEMLMKLVDIQYERNDVSLRAEQVPRAGGLRRDLARLRGVRVSDRVLGRRGRSVVADQPGQRRDVIDIRTSCSSTRPSIS
jgi:hypothetical protein